MILQQDVFSKTFHTILKTSLSYSACKLVIFVSAFNIDAICSAKIFIDVLKRDYFVYQLIPVLGYMDLKEKYAQLDGEITNVVLIGCGASADLESFLEINIKSHLPNDFDITALDELIKQEKFEQIPLNRKIYVIDGQRPWNLDNLYSSALVCCMDDGSTESLQDEKTAFHFVVENYKSDDEDESESEEEDNVEYENLAGSGSDNDEEENNKRRANRHERDNKKKKRTLMNQYNDIIESYYSQGTTLSIPSSLQMYDIISGMGESNLDLLWLAIIGTKSLRDKHETVYETVYPILKQEVNRLQSFENSYLLRETNSDSSKFNVDVNKKAGGVIIQPVKEFNLFMIHNWTLYNSFYYSNYVNSKIHLYTNEGKRLLKSIFARMGVSLNQANQNWNYIDIELKKQLNDLFLNILPNFDLTDIIIPGFQRYYGFNGVIDSSDCVNSITSLLEYNRSDGFQIKKKKKTPSGNGVDDENDDDENDESQDESESEKIKRIAIKRNESFIKSFWRAYDSLNDYDEIINGLQYSKIEQRFIFDRGSEILQKDMVKSHSKFKVVILNESFTSNSTLNDLEHNKFHDEETLEIQTLGSTQLFQNPLILTRLGNWILDVYSEIDGNLLPLIIGALDVEAGTYLICGLPPKTKIEDNDGKQQNLLNTFSVIFERVTQEINIQARIDSFQSAIIEIKKEDLGRFIEALSRSSQYITV